jgi:fibronectin-binding autotransporter adhesin
MQRYKPKRAGRNLFLILLACLPPAHADTINTWVGGTSACPTCWNQAGNWSPAGVPNGAFSVSISAAANQPVLNTSVSIDNLTISMGTSLQVANAQILTVNTANTGGLATISNAGNLTLGSTGNFTDLAFAGTGGIVTLNGAGTLTLSNSTANRIYAANAGMTLNNNSTIQGAGQIGLVGSSLILNNNGTGIIDANQSAGLIMGGTINNAGLLEATNGAALSLGGASLNNTGGTIAGSGTGSTVQLSGTNITGGTLQTGSGGQLLQSGGFSTFNGNVALNGTLNVANSSGIALNTAGGPMTLTGGAGGMVNLNGGANFTDIALNGAGGAVNLNAPVTLSNSAANRIYASSGGMTLNNNATLQGSGQIGVVGAALLLNNNSVINANQSAGLLVNGTIANTSGLLEATNGGTLTLSGSVNNTGSSISASGANTNLHLTNVTITNNGATISVDGAGSVGQLSGATINGGSLQATNGAQFTETGTFSTLGGTVALNGALNVTNAGGLNLNTGGGSMALNIGPGGGINLNSTGNLTDLSLQGTNGTVNLNGPVTLSNNAANRIYASSNGMTLINNSTIQGSGQIGLVGSALLLNNNGTGIVNANQSAALTLGGSIVNTGLLEATNGATLSLSGVTANNAGGTVSAAGTGSTVQLGGTTIFGGTLQGSGGGLFAQSGTFSTLNGTVALNGSLNIANGSGITLNTASGPMTLAGGAGGIVNVNGGANLTDISLAGSNGTVNLNGPVTLSNSANNRIYASNSGMTLNNNSTIEGSGQIGVVGSALTLNNNGLIGANQTAGLSVSGTIANTSGLLQATNGSTLTLGGSVNNTGSSISAFGANTNLHLTNVTIANNNGTISVDGAGSVGRLNGATINGGTLQTTNGAQFTGIGTFSTLAGTVALNGVLNVANAAGMNLNSGGGTMSLNIGSGGGLNLNGGANLTDLALVGTDGTVNLNGPVTLSNTANNRIYASNAGMTLNNNSTLQGAGQIGMVGSGMLLNNNATGIIDANQSAGMRLGGTIVNTGLLEATNGAALSLTGVTLNNTGGVVSAAGAGSTVQLGSTTITGGTLQGSGGGLFAQSGTFSTFNGTVALNGTLNVANASGLTLNAASGAMTLAGGTGGVVNLNGGANLTDLALTGTGGTVNLDAPVTLNNSANNRIYANSSGMTLNNGSTLQGSGQIGQVGSSIVFNNNGTVEATQPTALTIGAAVGQFTNNGTLSAAAGSTLAIASPNFTNFNSNTLTGGTYVVGGILQFNNADIVNNAATVTLTGSAAEIKDQNGLDGLRAFDNNTASGSFTLEGGALLTTPGAFSNAGSVDIFGSDFFGAGGAYTQTAGTTHVDGDLSASAVNIDGGVLKGTGTVIGAVTVTTGGAVSPGDSPGTLSITGNYIQTSSGILDLEFAGPGAGQFDVLNIGGSSSLSGTLDLVGLAGFTPFNGETFGVMNFASRTGTFSTVNGLDLGSGYRFHVQYNPGNVTLEVTSATPEPGSWAMLAIGLGVIGLTRRIRPRAR